MTRKSAAQWLVCWRVKGWDAAEVLCFLRAPAVLMCAVGWSAISQRLLGKQKTEWLKVFHSETYRFFLSAFLTNGKYNVSCSYIYENVVNLKSRSLSSLLSESSELRLKWGFAPVSRCSGQQSASVFYVSHILTSLSYKFDW